MWGRRLWRLGLLAGISGGLAVLLLAVVIALYGRTDRARMADVIVVLGAGSPGTERRARHAVSLYQRDLSPVIVCSGGYRDAPGGRTEAERCADELQNAGIPAAAIQLEDRSLNTHENARAVAELMHTQDWRTAILVTDNFHVWRAAWLFRLEGVTVWGSPAQATQGALEPDEWAISVLREVGAVGWHGKETLKETLRDWLKD